MEESNALSLPPGTPEKSRVLQRVYWEEEFLPVAQNLLARIHTHHTDLVPLDTPLADP